MKTTIMIFALSLCSVCANPEGDKFRKSFDAYSHNYVGECKPLDVDCNRRRLEILQIVADQARAYKATPEAATTFNGKLADAVIKGNGVEHAVYAKPNIGIPELNELIRVWQPIAALLMDEHDEAFKRSIQ
jgi:hypothetical protein